MSANIVDSEDSVRMLVETIENAAPKPFIFVDLEGVELSRHGSISIMQVLVPPNPIVHLVDVFLLQKVAFETAGTGGQTLRSILESSDYAKIFFDVRNDSDALYGHFQIRLDCVIDLQLVEFASRPGRGRFIKGLAKCISDDCRLDRAQSQEWKQIKEEGQRLFTPEKGGKYEVFLERPLPIAIEKYCVQDVSMMPKLLLVYGHRINSHLATQVHAEGLRRINLSQSRDFNGKGRHMAVGPVFTWTRPRNELPPDFPLSAVCSEEELAARCFLNDDLGSARPEEKLVTSTLSETAAMTRYPERGAEAALPRDLDTLQIGTSTSHGTEVKVADEEDRWEKNIEYGFNYRAGRSESDDDSGKDFTACSGDDCGWCGHCGY